MQQQKNTISKTTTTFNKTADGVISFDNKRNSPEKYLEQSYLIGSLQ